MQQIQRDIAQALQVQPPFQSEADVQAQIARRIAFIQQCLKDSGLKTLVLGIRRATSSSAISRRASAWSPSTPSPAPAAAW